MRKLKSYGRLAAFCLAAVLTLSCQTALAAGKTLIPMGNTVGITMESEGVIIVGLSSENGGSSPAQQAGLCEGDIITMLGSEPISSGEDLTNAVSRLDGSPVSITVLRSGSKMQFKLTPHMREDGKCELGVSLRDGLSGIGTLTYYDPETDTFGALGHSISDVDTGVLIPLRGGLILRSSVADVIESKEGMPGQLVGTFDPETVWGELSGNTCSGLFGQMDENVMTEGKQAIPVAETSEIHTGSATILSNVSGEDVDEYEIEIERIMTNASDGRCMTIKITDPRLLDMTGGIVQGMSGSPIIQDGKLAGAVTHVLVNDPTTGYGIFIGNMLSAAGDTLNSAA